MNMPTQKMLEWLRLLEIKPGSTRPRNRIGYLCMQRGWTEWDYRDRHGKQISVMEAKELWGNRWFEHVTTSGERLTDEGRTVLMAEIASRTP
jgi:hypothetical protein